MTQEDFKTLFDRYFEPLRKYLFFRSGNEALATDIAQECFLKIWEKQIPAAPQKQVALLYKMAGDMFVSHYRHQQVEQAFSTQPPSRDHSVTPEDEMNYKELSTRYASTLKAMPENQRVVFLMSREESLKNREIGQRLGLSVKAVEKRMSAALKYLKETLQEKSYR